MHLGSYKHTPFPIRLISQISIVYSIYLGTKWAEEEKSPSIPRNVFLLMSRYLLVVSLKKLKQSYINNSYRLKEYIVLESSKVCSG